MHGQSRLNVTSVGEDNGRLAQVLDGIAQDSHQVTSGSWIKHCSSCRGIGTANNISYVSVLLAYNEVA